MTSNLWWGLWEVGSTGKQGKFLIKQAIKYTMSGVNGIDAIIVKGIDYNIPNQMLHGKNR